MNVYTLEIRLVTTSHSRPNRVAIARVLTVLERVITSGILFSFAFVPRSNIACNRSKWYGSTPPFPIDRNENTTQCGTTASFLLTSHLKLKRAL